MASKATIAAVAIILVAVAILGLLILQQRGGGGGILPSPKPHFTIEGRNLRTAVEGLDYVAYIDVTVKNDGDAAGAATVYVKVMQGGNYWQKDTSVYLNSGETKTVTLRFSEVGLWTANPISYDVWLG
jgi:uncharacterized membrane protein